MSERRQEGRKIVIERKRTHIDVEADDDERG